MKDSQGVKKWNLEYLNEKIGDCKLFRLNRRNENFEIENMDDIYLNNNHTTFPDIYNDIKPEFEAFMGSLSSSNLRNIHIANLFIGKNGDKTTGSNMHCGGSGNFFCMLKGQKYWTLIDPVLSPLLKGRVSQSGIHAQTLFDMEDSPLDILPELFLRLPRYEVMLEEGDILWNPPWWWHRIGFDPSGEGVFVDNDLSASMAIRNNTLTWNNPTFTLSRWTYLVYNTLMRNLYERFQKLNQHFDDDILYQIEKLIEKYPTSLNLEDILNQPKS